MGVVRSKGSPHTAQAEAAECAQAQAEVGRVGFCSPLTRTDPRHPLKYTYDDGLTPPSTLTLDLYMEVKIPTPHFKCIPFS